jgi:hypothetical protein
MNRLPSEKAALVATIDPDVTTASTVLSDAVDMADFESIMATVLAGTLGASATLDAKLVQATTAGGTYKDITGKAITQMTQAGTDQSDTQAIINCRAEELDVDNEYRFVKLSLTVGTATSDVGAIIQGFNAAVNPASDNDLASVGEIV